MSIVIRPFQESDRPALRAITVEAFSGVSIDHNIDTVLGPIAGRDWRWRKARDFDLDVDFFRAEVAVAEDSEASHVLGYITMKLDSETKIGWIHNMAIASSARGVGLGRRLLIHAIEYLRASGMTVAKIETLEQNAIGAHLYPALGFREVARQIHFAMDLRSASAQS
jgi:ribosomal protein S18 acetylase RimI-like enzyme